MLRQSNAVQNVCPLLLPTSVSKRSYDGYLSAGGRDFRIRIIAPQEELRHARLDCDWKLKHILRGYEGVVQKRLEMSPDIASFLLEFKNIVERVQHVHPRFNPPPPPAFYSQLVADLDTLGWENIIYISSTFTDLKIRTQDQKRRDHIFSIHLSNQHPSVAPTCDAVLPLAFEPRWSPKGSLVDLLRQFEHELEKFQVFWDHVDELDQVTWVLEPERPNRACTHRRIVMGTSLSLHLSVDPLRPNSCPECRFLGPDHTVGPLRERLSSNVGHWDPRVSILQNLERTLEMKFPSPANTRKEEFSLECEICYAYLLEGAAPEVVCDNEHCAKAYHHKCIFEWLKSDGTSRQSFNTIFGNCPYCNHPISIKVLA